MATKNAKKSAAAISIPFADIRPLFGLSVDDPKVVELLSRAGKVTKTKPDGGEYYVSAKEAGFDFLVRRAERGKKGSPMVVNTAFLYSEGNDKHRQFAQPPYGLAFTSRAQLIASMPPPERTWLIGKGKVPVTTKTASHDRWLVDGIHISANYNDEQSVTSMQASLPDYTYG